VYDAICVSFSNSPSKWMSMPIPKARSIKDAVVSKGGSSEENAQKLQLAGDCEGIKKTTARQCQLDQRFGQGDLEAADAGPHEKQSVRLGQC
jgi:hypothetical protein